MNVMDRGAAGAMKKRAAIWINAKGRKLEENERRVDNFADIAPLFQIYIELTFRYVLISELHGETAATYCESTCSLARRRNIMLHREDEGTRRPLMHVHIRYRLRSSIRIASVPLPAVDCCTSAYRGLCGDIYISEPSSINELTILSRTLSIKEILICYLMVDNERVVRLQLKNEFGVQIIPLVSFFFTIFYSVIFIPTINKYLFPFYFPAYVVWHTPHKNTWIHEPRRAALDTRHSKMA
ncbi:hypothetical protein ALC56_05531 [Trachymyrmex septentrionalis]|uniref:Uncharacterized protein n=1 Tax=Trachymyrmex septentrionalis TaxID=34720 RepID=A0A151JXQ9_9HYME|nr:hypothetical protein ALC56_05531 [Trachymyrmex septentrionalis]